MIAGYHTQITERWPEEELHYKLNLLPQPLCNKIMAKRQHLDVQLSVTGYIMLLKLIDHFGLDLRLDDLQYGQYQRPFFAGGFDFNISHSGNRVICCGTTKGKLGVDVELMKPVTINYDDYFTAAEQQNIRAAKSPDALFFKYWTRKEAVLKAIGTGVYTPLLDIDVSDDEVHYGDEVYYLSSIDIAADFAGCLAYSVQQDIVLKKVIV
ncbi:4'-phosphopantetheinyl transferase family protein [Mucilaginibacter panaciglaebae]|uniref:4'-phosphopantetheinyl transferase domain-containing protein n=1 Tax=Mucilaginibacter panaciglaebae TaxID=502331 RepID=A0ABP7WGT2_9SPHI